MDPRGPRSRRDFESSTIVAGIERDEAVERVGDVPASRSGRRKIPVDERSRDAAAPDRVRRREVVVTDHVAPIRRADEDLPARGGGRLQGGGAARGRPASRAQRHAGSFLRRGRLESGRRRPARPSRTQDGAARAGEETGLDEQRHRVALGDGLAVEALDREALLRAVAANVLDQSGERGPEPTLFRVPQRDQRAAAALDEERGLTAEEDDFRTRDPGCPRPRPFRPRQGRAVRLCGVGGGEHERVGLVALARPQLAEPLDRAAEGELGAPEALDEVAAPAEAERLERLQLAVDGAVPAGNSLCPDAVTGDDPLPLEQQLGECPPIRTGPGTWSRDRAKEALRPRPATLRRGDLGRSAAGEAARPTLRLRYAVAATRAQRLPGVVRHLARPDEIPEGGQRLLGLEPGFRQQVEPEKGAALEHGAQLIVELPLGTVCRSHLAEHGRVLAEVDGHPVEAGADPDDLAGGAELVELLGPVVRYASREDIRLQKRDRKRESLQRN